MHIFDDMRFLKIAQQLRAFAVVELNSYIAILAPPKHQKQPCNSGTKGVFFFFFG